jgi:hypothetical protein
VRGTTPLQVGDVTGSRTAATGVVSLYTHFFSSDVSRILTDAPNSGLAQNYKVQITGLSGGALTTFVNRTGQNDNNGYTAHGSSYIRVYEVD